MITKAKAKTKTTLKAPAIPVPENDEQAAQLLKDIGVAQAAMKKIAANLEARKLELAMKASQESEPYSEEIDAKFEALFIYGQANRNRLLKGGAKTARLATGTLSWRWSTPKVEIAKGKGDDLLNLLLSNPRAYGDFVRTKHEIDREALLKAHAGDGQELVESIPHLKITQTEQFAAEADAIGVEVTATIKPAKGAK